MSEELYTPQEVAGILKIKKNTVYELIKRKELKSSKIGKQFRIRKDDLEAYLNYARKEEYEDEKTMQQGGMEEADKAKTAKIEAVESEDSQEEAVRINTAVSKTGSHKKTERGLVLSGQDILLEILCNYLSADLGDYPIFRSYLGSYNGLYSLYQDKVDVATVHLWDGEIDEYNTQYVKRMLPGTRYERIHLIKRMQGFYVKEGNPKQIRSFSDLTKDNITMINREKGSGTRILLDEYLIKYNIESTAINGYDKEVNSHLACAGAVARGSVDVAMGIERISKELKGIGFIPIQLESYDLVVKAESQKEVWYQKMLRIIRSTQFKEEIERFSGYDVTDMGKLLE